MARHFELHASKPDETIPFYKDLLSYFEWDVLGEWPGGLGMGDGNQVSLWLATPEDHRQHAFDRDATGLSHFAIWVDGREAVDTFVRDYMQPHGIEPQFETPRARGDFGGNYYQVMFVDPEGMAVEVYHA
jgi:catechol-2,3-dioxygenase